MIIYSCVESFLESISLLKGSFFTHYIKISYCIHMPGVLIIYLYYTNKINIIHSGYNIRKDSILFYSPLGDIKIYII